MATPTCAVTPLSCIAAISLEPCGALKTCSDWVIVISSPLGLERAVWSLPEHGLQSAIDQAKAHSYRLCREPFI